MQARDGTKAIKLYFCAPRRGRNPIG